MWSAGEAGAAAKARMRGSVLVQAMQAFKAALPGSQLEDFQDWQAKVGASVGVPPDASAAKEVCLLHSFRHAPHVCHVVHADHCFFCRQSAQITTDIGCAVQVRASEADEMHVRGQVMEAVWRGAQPLAAAEQRPLWSAELEGERALHWLETLQPECAWAQLLASAFNSAGALLARCKGAALPAGAEALSR